jgi:hypothetical protein
VTGRLARILRALAAALQRLWADGSWGGKILRTSPRDVAGS